MEDIKEILKKCNFSFKKSLGQNFICEENFLNSMVALAPVCETDTVVEIGCGAGTLTRALLKKVKKVLAFEVDKSLKPVLERTLSDCNAEVIFEDFLKVDLAKFEKEVGEYFLIANLPYYVTTPVIMKVIENSASCKGMLVMVQKEVALRLCASAGTPDYGSITAAVGLRATCKIVKNAPRTLFYPMPNVDSAVVLFDFNGGLEVKDEDSYKKVVRAAFLSRRKTLENNLVKSLSLTRTQAKRAIAACGFPEKVRGEELSREDFKTLSEYLFE